MAIPNNYIDKITKDGDSRDISPAADKVRVSNENFEGTDLDEVLDEIHDAIDDAGEGGYAPPAGGIPATDLAPAVQTSLDKADTAVQDPNYVHTSNDYTTAEKTKLAGLPTGSELTTSLGNKANAADVVKSISVNGTAQQKDVNGNVAISGLATSQQLAAKQDVLVSGTNIKTVNSQSLLGNGDIVIQGEKGDTGNVEFEDLADLVALLVNDLTTGGGGNFLSAEMGLVLRREITRVHDDLVTLYGKLANMAFWDAADRASAQPRSLNFNVSQVLVDFDLRGVGSGVSVKLNGESFNSPVSVDKGGTNTLTIQAVEDWVLNNDIGVEIDGVAQTLTQSGGIYSLNFVANADASIEVVGTATQEWFTAPKNDEGNPTTDSDHGRYGMQQGRSLSALYSSSYGGYATGGLDSSNNPTVIHIPASFPETQKLFTSAIPTGQSYGNTNPGKTKANYIPVPSTTLTGISGGKKYLHIKLTDTSSNPELYKWLFAVCCYGDTVIGNTNPNCASYSNVLVTGFVNRVQYAEQDSTDAYGVMSWKIDLHSFAASNGKSAGYITYIKLLVSKFIKSNDAAVDTRNWYDNMTVKYKFTDD